MARSRRRGGGGSRGGIPTWALLAGGAAAAWWFFLRKPAEQGGLPSVGPILDGIRGAVPGGDLLKLLWDSFAPGVPSPTTPAPGTHSSPLFAPLSDALASTQFVARNPMLAANILSTSLTGGFTSGFISPGVRTAIVAPSQTYGFAPIMGSPARPDIGGVGGFSTTPALQARAMAASRSPVSTRGVAPARTGGFSPARSASGPPNFKFSTAAASRGVSYFSRR